MTPLPDQLEFSRRLLNQMRKNRATPEDIAKQEAVVHTVERAKMLEEVGKEMGVTVEVGLV